MLQASCTCRSSCVMRAVCSDESWQGLQAPCSTSCGAGAAQCQGIWGSDPQSKPRGAAASRLCSSAPCAGRQPAYLVQIRDCVSAGSDLPKVYFEAFPKHARTRAGEWGESLEGGSPSKFTKIPLPVTCLGAPSPRSQTGPGLKKAFAAFKSKPRINCAF